MTQPSLKLDLTKAKEIQHEVAKKLIEKAQAANKDQPQAPKDDKAIQLELENSRLSKMLQSEMVSSQLSKKESQRLKKLVSQLNVVNQVLVESNKRSNNEKQLLLSELSTYRDTSSRILRSLHSEALKMIGADTSSPLCEYLKSLAQESEKVSPAKRNEGLDNTIDKGRVSKRQIKESTRELVNSLSKEVNKLKIVKDVSKGKKLTLQDKQGGKESNKAWSFCEEHENMENNFESKRDNLQNTYVLEGL